MVTLIGIVSGKTRRKLKALLVFWGLIYLEYTILAQEINSILI